MSVMKNEALTVIDYDKTFKIVMGSDQKSKAKISQVHVTFARLFLRSNLISMTKTLKYDARKLKLTKPAHKTLLIRKK